ncbi:hypothetical protein BYT27DRAFT_7235923 [Phlegmacium glaucopus]|nr:hypothetical protein BYT27DRAFT_7235923 [Phlegmacium glaucopus]
MALPSNSILATGHLTTHEELEATGINLQDWLNLTAHLGVNDSWASGNTDCAFSFNDCTGVQRSHRANDWNFFGIDLAKQGRATYTYMLEAPKLVETLTDNTTSTTDKHDVWDNRISPVPVQFTTSYQKSTEKNITITASQTSSLSISTGMNIEGVSFDVTASFDTTNTQANSKTDTVTSQDNVNATLPPGSVVDVDIVTTIHTKLMIYEVVFAIGSDNPEGSIAKATKTQGDWDKFFRIEDIAGDRVKTKTRIAISNASTALATSNVRTALVQQYLPAVLQLHVGP